MKSNPTGLKTLIAVLLTFALVSSAYAWGPDDKCNRKGNIDNKQWACPGKCFRGQLPDLSDKQKEQLKSLRRQFVDDTAETRISLNTATKNLGILLETSDPDDKDIKTRIKEITELRATLMEKRINHQLKVRKIAPELCRGKKSQACWLGNNPFDDERNMQRPDFPKGCCWQ